MQLELQAKRQADEVPDLLLLVEHPDVLTIGRRSSAKQNILRDEMPVFEVERGGDVTYHGPGQLVGYPIIKLSEEERDLHAYLRHLEDGLLSICAQYGLEAGRKKEFTGAWIAGERKIASIGIAVRRWVTLHGFALNVSTALERFAAINPCGLDATVMTSIAHETGRAITVEEVKPLAAQAMGDALGRNFIRREP